MGFPLAVTSTEKHAFQTLRSKMLGYMKYKLCLENLWPNKNLSDNIKISEIQLALQHYQTLVD